MAEVEDARERRVKWLRYSARALAVTWACSVSFFVVLVIERVLGWSALARDSLSLLPVLAFLVLLPWASTAIAWRREDIGAALLALESFIIVGIASIVVIWWLWPRSAVDIMWVEEAKMFGLVVSVTVCIGGIVMASPPCLLAILFLASWRKSRTSESPEPSEQDAG